MPTTLEIAAQYPIQIVHLSAEDGGGYKANYPPLALTVTGYGETQAEALADLLEVTPFALEGIAPEEMPAP